MTVTDTISRATSSKPFGISITSPVPQRQPVYITASASSANVAVGGTVSASFTASGGTGSYTFTASGLPGGVNLSTAGALSGAPTSAGNFSATITVTDSAGTQAFTSFSLNVLGLANGSLPGATVGQFYSANVNAAGGLQPYSFIGSGGPAGLSMSTNGAVTGTPRTAGSFTISVRVTDSGGASTTGSIGITVAVPAPLSITKAGLGDAQADTAYSQAFAASGGNPPYAWTLSNGVTPDGLSLASSGIVSGTPTTPGSYSWGIAVTDASGAVATATATLNVKAATLQITTQRRRCRMGSMAQIIHIRFWQPTAVHSLISGLSAAHCPPGSVSRRAVLSPVRRR